ncbi:MAG: response regulator [Limnospira sp. PMC 1291.21]|uniref:Multi-component transcriptional regulator, winged helix family n=1 Tax=Limnospira maxima CS-328 TaxID=513049 RepID=B5VWD3_LIMMA|nr:MULTISPECIES: response regulator [Limnospira]MDC0838258.1 response regulator [Limnoraphis robusta]EDZ96494.1 multi-component transcriptional regulator, winged helix family [Limnospira maxima CS-328]MDT9178598.1 response regulator [Limnospira sp. PMC 1238.20]MDT9193787.1 response regulator [Limnospira sp. PMC 1245.20]MDT9198910.1 response regulator [Limnospira sp. PMC 1042.18]
MRILLVEDDLHLADALVAMLTSQKYQVDLVNDGQQGWEYIQSSSYDLVLLDIELPLLDGISLCHQLRSHNFQVPILLLTARNNQQDKVKGLDAGADDYMVKPLDIAELSARIRALLRRSSEATSSVLTYEKMVLDTSTCDVSYNGKPLKLTPKEYGLLELLMGNRQRTFSIDKILDKLWTFDDPPSANTVRAHIKGLRQKLKAAGAGAEFIETVYGLGYRLNQNLEKPHSATARVNSEPNGDRQFQLNQSIQKVWERFRETLDDRIITIEKAIGAANDGQINLLMQQQARQEAHKLAGSLGTFGRREGSTVAREIELILQLDTPLIIEHLPSLSILIGRLRQIVETASPNNCTSDQQQIDSPRLLIIDTNEPFIQNLIIEASRHQIQAEIITEEATIRKICDRTPSGREKNMLQLLPSPQVVLLNFDRYPFRQLLVDLTQQKPPIPTVVFTTQGDISKRVEVVRLGGSAFLEKPVTIERAIAVVRDVFRQYYAINTRVMIVDDDPQMLAAIQGLLQPWGIQTITLDDPRQFWKTLESSHPDLLVLDIEMPHLNGIELCQIVRNDPRWRGLPVLFVTAQTDRQIREQVFQAGADDYLTKPFTGSELATRIVNRLKRTQNLATRTDFAYH